VARRYFGGNGRRGCSRSAWGKAVPDDQSPHFKVRSKLPVAVAFSRDSGFFGMVVTLTRWAYQAAGGGRGGVPLVWHCRISIWCWASACCVVCGQDLVEASVESIEHILLSCHTESGPRGVRLSSWVLCACRLWCVRGRRARGRRPSMLAVRQLSGPHTCRGSS